MSQSEHAPIPHFTLPETYNSDQDRNYRAFRSPEDGEIVQILDTLWHANPVKDWMLEDGDKLILKDFQEAAQIAYVDDKIDVRMNMAGLAFNSILQPMIIGAVHDAWQNPNYSTNPYRPYASWMKDQYRRQQYLISTQAAHDTYISFKQHENPAKRRLKFIRTFDVLFDEEPVEELEQGNAFDHTLDFDTAE